MLENPILPIHLMRAKSKDRVKWKKLRCTGPVYVTPKEVFLCIFCAYSSAPRGA